MASNDSAPLITGDKQPLLAPSNDHLQKLIPANQKGLNRVSDYGTASGLQNNSPTNGSSNLSHSRSSIQNVYESLDSATNPGYGVSLSSNSNSSMVATPEHEPKPIKSSNDRTILSKPMRAAAVMGGGPMVTTFANGGGGGGNGNNNSGGSTQGTPTSTNNAYPSDSLGLEPQSSNSSSFQHSDGGAPDPSPLDTVDIDMKPAVWQTFLDDYFQIAERGSTIGTEIRAGIVTFLTMSYIVLVNPKVLSVSHIPQEYAASATCLASCIASLIAGLLGNLPVGCAPGVGLSAYFSYGMMSMIRNGSPDLADNAYLTGLSITFLAGLVVFVLTITKVIPFIMDHIPTFIKLSTVVGMGLFLTFIGLLRAGVVEEGVGGETALQLGSLDNWMVWLALANIMAITIFEIFHVKGSLLCGIVVCALIYWAITGLWPNNFIEIPHFADPFAILSFKNMPLGALLSAGVSFVLILMFDVSGVVYGVGKMANLVVLNANGKETVEGGHWALVAASVGTIIASLTGCSPIIVHAESVAGVAAGGRTGLTACVIGILFLISIFLAPVFGDVPDIATAPCLVLVGVFMMKQVSEIEWSLPGSNEINMKTAMPAFLTIIMMPFTYSIANGIFFGLATYLIVLVFSGDIFRSLGWLKKIEQGPTSGATDMPPKHTTGMKYTQPLTNADRLELGGNDVGINMATDAGQFRTPQTPYV